MGCQTNKCGCKKKGNHCGPGCSCQGCKNLPITEASAIGLSSSDSASQSEEGSSESSDDSDNDNNIMIDIITDISDEDVHVVDMPF